MRKYSRQYYIPLWLKAGPWKILQDCPARGHNTAIWARKKLGERCICPRAKRIYEEYRAAQNERQKERDRSRTSKPEGIDLRKRAKVRKGAPLPDWRRGLCVDDPETVQKGENTEASKEGIADRLEMKGLCEICPVRQECRDWILASEEVPGSLGGVYGGLDKWNRRGKDMRIINGRIRVVNMDKGWENVWQ